jgi:hypothetical protein
MERLRFENELKKLDNVQCPCCKAQLDAILDCDRIGQAIQDILSGEYLVYYITNFDLQCGHKVSLRMGEGRFWLEAR